MENQISFADRVGVDSLESFIAFCEKNRKIVDLDKNPLIKCKVTTVMDARVSENGTVYNSFGTNAMTKSQYIKALKLAQAGEFDEALKVACWGAFFTDSDTGEAIKPVQAGHFIEAEVVPNVYINDEGEEVTDYQISRNYTKIEASNGESAKSIAEALLKKEGPAVVADDAVAANQG